MWFALQIECTHSHEKATYIFICGYLIVVCFYLDFKYIEIRSRIDWCMCIVITTFIMTVVVVTGYNGIVTDGEMILFMKTLAKFYQYTSYLSDLHRQNLSTFNFFHESSSLIFSVQPLLVIIFENIFLVVTNISKSINSSSCAK